MESVCDTQSVFPIKRFGLPDQVAVQWLHIFAGSTGAALTDRLLSNYIRSQDIKAASLMWIDTSGESFGTQEATGCTSFVFTPKKGKTADNTVGRVDEAVLLDERTGSAVNVNNALTETLQDMGARTRRSLSFLKPELTQPSPMKVQSQFKPELTGPVNQTTWQGTAWV